jgi:mannose/fructose/N-acetylgalactosamine-specific phosphotransferase system component IIC
MTAAKRRYPPKRNREPLLTGIGQSLIRHLKQHAAWYVPVVVPFLISVLAHLLALLVFFLVKMNIVEGDQGIYKTVVTWAFYGFRPLLLCSYLCFFALARPGITILAQKMPQWTDDNLHLVNGLIYGAGIGLTLLFWLNPGVGPKALLIFAVGLVVGLGNWFVYRKLALLDPLAGQRPDNEPAQEVVEP